IVPEDVDYSGNRMLNSPRLASSGHIQLDVPIGRFGSLVPRFDWTFKSQVYFDPNQGRGIEGTFPKGTIGQDDLWRFNAQLTYRTPAGNIEVSGWVRNLTNESYIVDAFDTSQGFGSILFVIGTPRLYGLSLSLRF